MGHVRITTSQATDAQTAAKQLTPSNGKDSDVSLCLFDVELDAKTLAAGLKSNVPGRVIGMSSCQGAMAITGTHAQAKNKAVLWTVTDDEGALGIAMGSAKDDPRTEAQRVLQAALDNADRSHECPDLIWCILSPGREEEILEGFQDLVGSEVPIIGGSSADNTVTGEWKQFCNDEVFQDGIGALVIFSSTPLGYAFNSGYVPTAHRAQVTQSNQRKLESLNDKPAFQVYNDWLENALDDFKGGGNILAKSSLHPIGRTVSNVMGVEQYLLSHPDEVHADGSMSLFSCLAPGDDIVLMEGNLESLVDRAQNVVDSAISLLPDGKKASGVILVYCAGCMLTLGDTLSQVQTQLKDRLGDIPLAGAYTFGEQGHFLDGTNRHGNLMISAVVISE